MKTKMKILGWYLMNGTSNMLKEDERVEMLMLEFILELDVDSRFSEFLDEQSKEDDIRLAECRQAMVAAAAISPNMAAYIDIDNALETRTSVLLKFVKLVNAEDELNAFLMQHTVVH